MPHAFFWIPAVSPAEAQDELNRFLGSHRVLSVDRGFVSDGMRSGWAVAVDYADGPNVRPPGPRGKVDYREVLDPETFAVFATLRTWRKVLAEKEGVPAYAIVTNEQMAALAQLNPATLDELKTIEGLGEARVRKYGRMLVEVLKQARSAPSQSNVPRSKPDETDR